MALSFTEPKVVLPNNNSGGQYGQRRVVDVTYDSSYPTGGLAFTAANFGLGSILYLQPIGIASAGVFPVVDHANSKLKAFWCAGAGAVATEVTATTNLSTQTVRVVAVGTPA